MKLFRYHQIGQEFLSKRMVYKTTNLPDAAAPDDEKKAPSYSPQQEQSEIQKAATRLKVDEILSSAGDNQSSEQIATRIKTIHDLRQAGDIKTLNRNIMSWYGNHPIYRTYIAAAGGTVNPGIINQIRTDELALMRGQLQQEAQLEMDDITAQQAPPNFAFALAHLTGGGGPGNRLSTETQALLGEIHLNAPNSATEYLELTHQREELQNRLDISQAEIHRAKSALEAHNTEKTLFQEEKVRFDQKMSGWLGNAAKTLGLVGGIAGLGGLGALIGGPATWTGLGIGAASILVGGGTLGAIGKFFRKPKELVQHVRHWFTAWGHERVIRRQEESDVVRERRRAVLNADKRLEGLRLENAGKLAVLQRQYNDYKQAIIDAPNEAERNQLDQRMQSLATMMTLYRVSEGNYAKRITAPGPITNDFVVQQLHALGVSGVDDDTDAEADLVRLAQSDDLNHVKNHQTTLQTIGLGDDIMKEVHTLDNAEETQLRNFLNNPNLPAAIVLTPDFRRKAVRMVAVVDSLHALPDNNAWRESFRLAILKEMDGREGSIIQSSLMSVLSDMELSNKETAKRIRRNPSLLVAYAQQQNLDAHNTGNQLPYDGTIPSAPRNGEDIDSWTKRISPQETGYALAILEDARGLQIDNEGNLVDRLTPIRVQIAAVYNTLNGDLQNLLDNDPNPVLIKIAQEVFGKSSRTFDLSVAGGLTFSQALNDVVDGKTISEIRHLLVELRNSAFVRNGEIEFFRNDSEKIYQELEKIEDNEISTLIKNHPECLSPIGQGNIPSFTALNPNANNFDEYLRSITEQQRTAIITKISKIKNPSNPFVLNENKNSLENERIQLRNKAVRLFNAFNTNLSSVANRQAAYVRLNSNTFGDVRTTLQSATRIVFGQRKTVYLSNQGNNFASRVNNMTQVWQLKELVELLEGIEANCNYDNANAIFTQRP